MKSFNLSLCLLIVLVSAVHILGDDDPYYVYPDVFNDPERDAFYVDKFPEGFVWSTMTSAYQVEGGWDADGKGENIWDRFTHSGDLPDADVACDSYNKYMVDIDLIVGMGLKSYSFSLSWSRLLPDGTVANASAEGLAYYNNLIDALIEKDITPQVTLYYWDLPSAIEDLGGVLDNEIFLPLFNDYAKYCFRQFGDRVKWWVTIHDPWVISIMSYGVGTFAPGTQGAYDNRIYLAGHNLLLAHSMAYRSYEAEFKQTQHGKVGITLSSDFIEAHTNNPKDVEAAERTLQFYIGWFASPIFKTGDYPSIMREKIDFKSSALGLSESRLPVFTDDQMDMLLNSYDFLGLSSYTTSYAMDTGMVYLTAPPSYFNDKDVMLWKDGDWPMSASEWVRHVPWGIRRLLNWVKEEYGSDVPIYIVANGVSTPAEDGDDVDDPSRVMFQSAYINEILKAIKMDNVMVKGFSSILMDGFQWNSGYTERYGIHHVDFTDPNRPRKQKMSALAYTKIVSDNGFTSLPGAAGQLTLPITLIFICLAGVSAVF